MTPQPKAPQGTPAETTINTTRKQQPSDPGAAAKLPHERDQSVDMTDGKAPPGNEAGTSGSEARPQGCGCPRCGRKAAGKQDSHQITPSPSPGPGPL